MSFSRSLFEENGLMSEKLHGYEVRPQQLEMVQAIEEAVQGSKNLIVEAGTGVGKSLAYLVPFIYWAVKENKRVVISTYTKALQNQLFVKDLPFLKNVLDCDFKYALCMGAGNIVCLRKFHKETGADLFESKRTKEQVDRIREWIEETDTGLVTDMDFVPDRTVWDKFSREPDICHGKKCPYDDKCFYKRSRIRQTEAHVLVTNHALLFTDLISDAPVLPEFHGLVLDEAHTLEDVATSHFGREISKTGLKHLVDGLKELVLEKDIVKMSILANIAEMVGVVRKLTGELTSASKRFFTEAGEKLGIREGVVPFENKGFVCEDVSDALMSLASILFVLSRALGDSESRSLAKAYAQRCNRFLESIDFIFSGDNEQYVHWVDIRERKKKINYSFHAAPIDISSHMREYLFERICPVILTSATLSTKSGRTDFSFIEARLGLDDPLELELDSSFDYENNVLLYMPGDIIDPNKDMSAYKKSVSDEITDIYDIMGGRIFALFTSYDMLNSAAEKIGLEREDIHILKQGDMPRYVLLDVFKKNRKSILFGTTTFWQGVDIPGSSLECVIITKLPFSVPSDPINSARIESIRNNGENPFMEYQLPKAIIMFKQGFGRLIRSQSDRGVVAVLDPRVKTRKYGGEFLKALPKCRKTSDLQDIRNFFE